MTPFDLEQIDRLLLTTRAVRKRLDLERPVESEPVLDCLRIALQAPTGLNAQDWRWIVIRDAEKRRAIGDCFARAGDSYFAGVLEAARESGDARQVRVYESILYLANHLGEVPVLVIPCMKRLPGDASDALASSHYGSIYPAVWSFQLALHSRGLGSTLTTLHLIFEQECAKLLQIPDGFTQVCLLPVAHIKGGDLRQAPRRPLEEVMSWDGWDPRWPNTLPDQTS
ncbi:MAG: nitroreductase family protein [Deltaproteobacteria bacterium]|nr:nitroreductase family protein [Deltaproteobacteria bacterium]